MKRLKVITVVGTRPEIIRLSRVLNKLNIHESIDHILIHTGQNYDYELNKIFFEDLELKEPDFFLNAAGSSSAETIGNILSKIDPILETEKPDAFLVLGDTNSCLCAIPAKKRKIPIFHMEAGNRCFDQRVPEETNRKIVDHISDINLTYSSIAREYLLNEGFPADRIIKTGSPMLEVLNYNQKKFEGSDILKRLGIKHKNYFLVSIHREENVEDTKNFIKLFQCLNKICETEKLPIIVSTHPRTAKKIEGLKIVLNSLIRLEKPFGFNDYIALQINSKVVLSDSGTISEESSILNLRSLNIREAHERPESMEEATVMMTGLDETRILQAIEIIKKEELLGLKFNSVKDYSIMNVSDKVVRIILSYTDYVNRNVWKKY